MAPGANYMGGKRNAARARSKDATGRVHKNFFGRQRLDILSKGLSGRAPSGGSSSGCGPRVSASDIGLSHARHLAPDQNTVPVPQFLPPPERKRTSHTRSSSGSIGTSRVLEALDTTEPTAMRAAINKILSIPDLAGLSTRHVHTPLRGSKRPRAALESDSRREIKRQKNRTPSPSIQQDAMLDQFEPIAVDVDESDYQSSTQDSDGYEPIFVCDPVQSSPSFLRFNKAADVSESENKPSVGAPAPRPFNHPSISLSSFSPGIAYNPKRSSPPKRDEHESKKFVLRDNLYDYQDPWNAIGVILGLEDGQDGSMSDENPDEILDRPDDKAASVHPQHSSDTNRSHGSSTHDHDLTTLLTIPANLSLLLLHVRHCKLIPPNLAPSGPDDTALQDPLASSAHYSTQFNPTTPLSRIENKPPFYLDDFDDEDEMLAEQVHTPPRSTHHPTEPNPTTPLSRVKNEPSSSFDSVDDDKATPEQMHAASSAGLKRSAPIPLHAIPPMPKFAKFPLARDVNRSATRLPTSHAIHSPPSIAPDQVARLDAEVTQSSPESLHTQRPVDDVAVEYPEGAQGAGLIPHTQAEDQFVGEVSAEEDIEVDVACAPQPETFFGDLCLFSDDVDDPDSDG
ncbi:hypothetical protein B0H17DRAFT_1201930 [Mycena rosella]|uniref:Uncharacterized protein n=1 Tax=Mycena rosella TaxID=1033263 RepID=A0AAD7DFG9_MYCRO|nr:hypothetical protein B0H17DRAFT_1201930 [Mycena rosella]